MATYRHSRQLEATYFLANNRLHGGELWRTAVPTD